jgi:hypothetical protein
VYDPVIRRSDSLCCRWSTSVHSRPLSSGLQRLWAQHIAQRTDLFPLPYLPLPCSIVSVRFAVSRTGTSTSTPTSRRGPELRRLVSDLHRFILPEFTSSRFVLSCALVMIYLLMTARSSFDSKIACQHPEGGANHARNESPQHHQADQLQRER